MTTDYRRLLSEILIRRMENPRLGRVFPGYAGYSPLGVVRGADLAPDYYDGVRDLPGRLRDCLSRQMERLGRLRRGGVDAAMEYGRLISWLIRESC